MKLCKTCRIEKSLFSFYKNKTYKDGYTSKCKQCHNRQTTENYLKNPQINENNKKRYFADIDRERNRDYKRKYNISIKDYENMLEKQDGKCSICSIKAEDASKNRLFVDHCHSTGKVRGLLCHHCNTMIGLAKDDVETLLNAVTYLKGNNG
jgi:nitrate/TMAO reductase-like tetraheme cytochrome c subunit